MQFFGLPNFCPILRLILDLDTNMGIDHLGVFPLFLKKVANIITPRLSRIFLKLIRLGSFPECWRPAKVTAIPKGASSPDRENYGPIPITPSLSKVCEKLVSHKLSIVCEKYGLPKIQFSYRKDLPALMHCLPYLITFKSP